VSRFSPPERDTPRRSRLLLTLRDPDLPVSERDRVHAALRGGRPLVRYVGHGDGSVTLSRGSLIELVQRAKEAG